MMIKRPQAATRGRTARRSQANGIVTFDFEKATYHIDVQRRKVYQKWIEVERTKQSAIISAFRAANSLQV